MFETLISQYLNKLIESKVGDFSTPEAFHAVKVERLGDDKVEPLTQVSCRFVVPIFALVGDFAVKPYQCSDGTPPVTRTFLLATDAFVEFSEFVQDMFQGLRMLNLLAVAESQIGLHPEVYPYAFTCSGQDFFGVAICHNIEVACANSISTDLDIPDVSLIVAMVMIQNIPTLEDKLFWRCVPFFERQADRACNEFVSCLKLRRAVTPFAFELRGTDTSAPSALLDPSKESLVGNMDADNHRVKGIAWYPCPMLLGTLEQLRQVGLKPIPTGVFTIDAVISLFQSKEVIMHIPKIVEHITQTLVLRMLAYLIFVGSHSVTSYQLFNPVQVGRQTRNLAITLELSANWSK